MPPVCAGKLVQLQGGGGGGGGGGGLRLYTVSSALINPIVDTYMLPALLLRLTVYASLSVT